MLDWLDTFLTNHQELIGLAIFLIAFIECMALLGLAIPGATMLMIASAIAGGFDYPLWKAILLGILGGWLGDMLSYGIGYKLKSRVYQAAVIKNHPKWINMADGYFQRFGGMGLLIGRFISPLRPIMPMMAGIFQLSFTKCLFVTFISSIAWSVTFVVPGWVTGAAFTLPVGKQFWLELGCVVAILGTLLGIGIYGCIKQKRWIAAYMSFVSFLLLLALYLFLPYLQSLDQGLLLIAKEVRSPEFDSVNQFITELGGYKVQFVISAVLCCLLLFMRQIKPLIFFACTMFGTATIGWIIKETVDRARPQAMTDIMQTFSFPSGHTSASFAFFLSLGVLAGLGRSSKTRMLWLFIASLPAVLIALSRVYLGVHWVTDVVAGGLLATGICMLVLAWVESREKMQPLPHKCWKILLPVGLLVIIVATTVTFFKHSV
ncbi:bifunctional DedA family/phosphatase PAP2 family protein [Entomomonas sp. E2T0]|uniref:bifunctional DedA family/phosphatase PAP2 family protein n=1 Tax=Entomomonas sp. E2T0 TaxID=2930213 RepID=UPI002228176B|nr:bifunctional DedA family/phosphatase PAP2 family protein [Entomomonas sp. E2T0]UYZ83265.1 bifunctional DedA family/phosphatase PAP2 family protein [Entomomonas sp. E2T0]